jgi:hypothetical protein
VVGDVPAGERRESDIPALAQPDISDGVLEQTVVV